jgi:hypothetical protein
MAEENQGVSFPKDVTSLSIEELAKLEAAAVKEFAAVTEGQMDATKFARAEQLADGIEAVRNARASHEKSAKEAEALAAMKSRVEAGTELAKTEDDDDKNKDGVVAGGARTEEREPPTSKLNPSLGEIQRRQRAVAETRGRRESVLVASADIPDFAVGSQLPDMDALVAAMQSRARALPIMARGDSTTRYPIATLQRDYRYTLDMSATPGDINQVLTAAADVDSLVAAGGWCSPSEISYDFYNIVASDGILDLPTVGINRGGMRWPTSPSFGDLVGNAAMWSWTETQDIAAVTGTDQSGTKTCARVPCPTFNEERLTCDGLCLTVGNLTEDAYPELIANHTRLLFAAHAHKMNAKRITELVTASTAVTGTNNVTGMGVVAPVLGALSLQAIDYRDKYAMADGAILEVVLPRWLRGAMRSDMRKRTGVDLLEFNDARIMRMLDAEGLRVQWVNDWQVRTTGFPGNSSAIAVWPTTVNALMYAPGTFVLGQGMRLDLGIIRDSVLNATNDHTAEWMEECWLIAMVGHESRNISIPICPDGTTGAADLTGCTV